MNRREAMIHHIKYVVLKVVGMIVVSAIAVAAIYGLLWIVSLVEGM